jgi:GNAT superfamily N-acetyltransferase
VAEVTVRDAHRGDAPAIGEIWSAAVPYLVRTAARAAADMREDKTMRRRRWVGLVDGVVAGTATARQVGEHEVFVSVEVHPDHGSRGVGTALLSQAAATYAQVDQMRSVSNGDPISLAFAVRNGFLPEGEHRISFADPAAVPEAGPPPSGLRPVTLEALPDLRMLLETYNLSAGDDPSGLSRRYTMYQLRSEWWDSPDNAPGLSFGLIDDSAPRPVLASFTSVQVDRERSRCWSSMTCTHPAYRRRGMARWVKQRMLNELVGSGVTEAWTGNDSTNEAMIAVNEQLGYVMAATSIRLARRLSF